MELHKFQIAQPGASTCCNGQAVGSCLWGIGGVAKELPGSPGCQDNGGCRIYLQALVCMTCYHAIDVLLLEYQVFYGGVLEYCDPRCLAHCLPQGTDHLRSGGVPLRMHNPRLAMGSLATQGQTVRGGIEVGSQLHKPPDTGRSFLGEHGNCRRLGNAATHRQGILGMQGRRIFLPERHSDPALRPDAGATLAQLCFGE
jgi:hypothetical protein